MIKDVPMSITSFVVIGHNPAERGSFDYMLLWISPCLPSGAKHNNGLGSPLPRVLVGD